MSHVLHVSCLTLDPVSLGVGATMQSLIRALALVIKPLSLMPLGRQTLRKAQNPKPPEPLNGYDLKA